MAKNKLKVTKLNKIETKRDAAWAKDDTKDQQEGRDEGLNKKKLRSQS